MMKLTMFIGWTLLAISCSTNHVKHQIITEQEILEDTIKEDKIIGASLPSWIRKSGIEHGTVYVVGKAEFSANKSPFYVEKAALMDAEMALFTDAPSDIRILTQNAMTGAGIDSAEFYQVQTKLQEVIGVTGIRHDSEKVACRKIIRYGELSTRIVRACWVQASIPVKELVKAYRRTLAMKFGDYKANEFKNLMNDELEKINNNPIRSRRETINSNSSSNKNSKRTRLPSKQVEAHQRQQEVRDGNSQRKDLRRSQVKLSKTNAQGRISSRNQVQGNSKANKL